MDGWIDGWMAWTVRPSVCRLSVTLLRRAHCKSLLFGYFCTI